MFVVHIIDSMLLSWLIFMQDLKTFNGVDIIHESISVEKIARQSIRRKMTVFDVDSEFGRAKRSPV